MDGHVQTGWPDGLTPRSAPVLAAVGVVSLGLIAMGETAERDPCRRQPQVRDVPTHSLPRAELLGTPDVRVLLGYTRRVLRLHDGHTLAVMSYSSAAAANWLFLVDGRDLSVQRYDMPSNDVGSHGAALGADGNLYFMPYGNSRLHRFDTATREFTTVQTALPATEYTWDALGTSDGRVFFGTYPNAILGEYDTATGGLEIRKQVVPNTKYVTDFSEDARGNIRCRAWGPENIWLVLDAKTRSLTPGPPEPTASTSAGLRPPKVPDGDSDWRGLATVDSRRFAIGHPSGRLWEIATDGSTALRGETRAFAEPSWWLQVVADGVVGISYFGVVFRHDLKTGQFNSRQMPNSAPGGNGLMFVEAVGGRWIVGANYSQQNLFRMDIETGETTQPPWVIARTTGEPMCAVSLGAKAFLGVYTQSILMEYDATRPFGYAENPRALVELGGKYQQTRPRSAVTDGKLVYISSDSAYNHLGGALAVIDPATDTVDVYHHVVKDQDLPTLAFDPASGLLWGGTNRWGQMRSHPPTQESSLVYAFDPSSRQVVRTLTPWPGADETSVLGVSQEGVLVASSGAEVALIDTETADILYRGPLPVGVPRRIRRAADGRSYCLSGGLLNNWDFARNTLTPVAQAPGCVFLSEVRPSVWALGDSTSVYRVSLTSE